MEQINKIELQGRVGTVRIQTYNGHRVANFSVAVDTAFKNRAGELTIDTTWFNCVAWENTPGRLDNLVKGAPIHIHGRVRQRKYTAQDGSERTSFEVLVFNYSIVTEEPKEPVPDDLPADDLLGF